MSGVESSSIKKEPQIHPTWKEQLADEFEKPYFTNLKSFLVQEKTQYTIYPPGPQIFRAFNETPFPRVKVVLIGQDPYHGEGQAEGLSFSVAPGVKAPPSLVNIYKELHEDVGFKIPTHGHLGAWTRQGVLLLNTVLTVRAGQPASHRHKGWEEFTDTAIRKLSENRENLVFLFWGKFAQEKAALVDDTKHLILSAPHPSPYSAATGFFGCRHFSQTNQYLEDNGITPIYWELD